MNRKNLFLVWVTMLGWSVRGILAQTPPPDRDMIAYVPMRTDLADHSAANNPVKTTGAVVLRDGAAYFNGHHTSLELPHFDFANRPFSISLWVKVTGKHPMYGLIQQKGADAFYHWLHMMLRGGRQPYLGFYVNDAISPEEVPAGKWSQLIFQYTGTRQELWIDGRLLCARTAEAYQGTNGVTIIGTSPEWNNVPSKDYEGFLRDLRIYPRALSASEIVGLYNLETDVPARRLSPDTDSNAVPALSQAVAAQVGIPFLDIEGSKLIITGESGQIYEVQATSDLMQPWQPLVTLTNRLGVVEYVDPDASQFSQRFYRVKTD